MISLLYRKENRRAFLLGAALVIFLVALADWWTKPYISIGFLYLFPIILVAGYLKRWQIVLVALLCAVLQEVFSELPSSEAIARLVMASAGYLGTGLFFSEIFRNRQRAMDHLAELERQVALRREVEEQLRVLVESSPVAILTLDAGGTILMANEASGTLLDPEGPSLVGQGIAGYIPALQAALRPGSHRLFRAELRCRARRRDGEVFLAAIWFSTFETARGARLAAIMVDLSEDLRDRDDLSLDHLLRNTKIVMSAIAHEIRNLSGAGMVVHRNLSRLPELQDNEDFRALGSLIQGLEKLSSMELAPGGGLHLEAVDLPGVLDEFRVVIEPACREAGVAMTWQLDEDLPLVSGESYGLAQVFLNLSRNALAAMETTPVKRFQVASEVGPETVTLRFEDTGVGIKDPELLFRPFQGDAVATGLGLYVSRALLRGCGGELTFEPRAAGCCFKVTLLRTAPTP